MSTPHTSQKITLIDSHCHLDMEAYEDDLDQVLEQATHQGIGAIVTIGINKETSEKAVQLARRYPFVYAAVGVHPHDADKINKDDFEALAQMAAHEKVVGYGEIGLDYAKLYSPKDVQQDIFIRQLVMAKELHLPVIIHDREAHEDCLRILKQHAPFPAGGVMHCFSGDLELARQVLDLGFYISIPGIVTFKNAVALQDVASEVPLESMILETDGPFLAPVPFRGKRNTPDLLYHTAEKIAELRDIPLQVVADQTTENTRKFFRLPALTC